MTSAAELAAFLDVPMHGPDMDVVQARSLTNTISNALVFLSRDDDAAIGRLNEIGAVVCVTTDVLADRLSCTVIEHNRPRLAFCQILGRFFCQPDEPIAAPTAVVSPTAKLAEGVIFGAGCIIGSGARIGPGTRLSHNVVVTAQTTIGRDCVIKSNTTIGEPGFGFATDEQGVPVRFPHIGSVCIGDNVEIGANCTVVRATLEATVVDDHVKTDDHVHIAHNSRIGPRTMIAAGAVLSGSVVIGAEVWIGPNATIIDHVEIGDRTRVGIGSVVVRSVPPGSTVLGNPARRPPGKNA